MQSKDPPQIELKIHPLTSERWPDLEALFGDRGACGGCWCMWWRHKSRSDFKQAKGDRNRRALKRIVRAGDVPGLIAYVGHRPIGWCALAPRDQYPLLQRSRSLKRVDEQRVWSVVCFFVARPFRGRGVTGRLLRAAIDYAKRHGARILEGYPIDPSKGRTADAFVYTGLASTFRGAGFEEVARRSATRPIMRYAIR